METKEKKTPSNIDKKTVKKKPLMKKKSDIIKLGN